MSFSRPLSRPLPLSVRLASALVNPFDSRDPTYPLDSKRVLEVSVDLRVAEKVCDKNRFAAPSSQQKSRCRELHPNLPIFQLVFSLKLVFCGALAGRSVLDSRGAATGGAVK